MTSQPLHAKLRAICKSTAHNIKKSVSHLALNTYISYVSYPVPYIPNNPFAVCKSFLHEKEMFTKPHVAKA